MSGEMCTGRVGLESALGKSEVGNLVMGRLVGEHRATATARAAATGQLRAGGAQGAQERHWDQVACRRA